MTVTLKDKLEILVPTTLQRRVGFKLGDQLELRASRGVILIVPKSEQPSSFLTALRATQEEAKANGMDKMTMKQINSEIAAYRKEKREKAAKTSAK